MWALMMIPGDDTSYLYLVRELKRDVFTHLHLSFFIIWLIALRWAKICYCFVHKYTLSITNSTSVAVACGVRLSCSVFMVYSVLLSVSLVARAPSIALRLPCVYVWREAWL